MLHYKEHLEHIQCHLVSRLYYLRVPALQEYLQQFHWVGTCATFLIWSLLQEIICGSLRVTLAVAVADLPPNFEFLRALEMTSRAAFVERTQHYFLYIVRIIEM